MKAKLSNSYIKSSSKTLSKKKSTNQSTIQIEQPSIPSSVILIKDTQNNLQQIMKIKHQIHQLGISFDNQLYAITKDDYRLITSKNLPQNMLRQEPIKFNYSSFFKTLQIKSVVLTGLSHIFTITRDGVAFGLGNNDFGQLGLPLLQQKGFNTNPLNPAQVAQNAQMAQLIGSCQASQRHSAEQAMQYQQWTPLMSFVDQGILIRDIKCGDDFSIFISQDIQPRIFVSGQNSHYQLFGFQSALTTVPQEVDLSDLKANCIAQDYVKQLECGSTFTCILMVSGKVYVQGTINNVQIKFPLQVQAPNIEVIQIYCHRNLLLVVDRYGQIFQYDSQTNNVQHINFLKSIQAKELYFQSQFQLFIKSTKNIMFRVNIQAQTVQIVNEKIQLFAANDQFTSFCYLAKESSVDIHKPKKSVCESNTSNNTSKINKSQLNLSKSSVMKSIKAGIKKKLSSKPMQLNELYVSNDINQIVNQDLNIPSNIDNQQSDLLDKVKAQQQVLMLQRMLDQMQQESIELKSQVKSLKDSKEKDQQLIKMLCENLDQYQAGLPCNQCKLYEIEIKTLKQNMDLQTERIDQLQRDSILVFQQSIANRSIVEASGTQYLRRSPISRTTPLTADPSAFFHDITNFNNNQITQYSNRSGHNGATVNAFEIMRKSDCYGEIDSLERRKYFTSSQNTKRQSPGNNYKRASTQLTYNKNSDRKNQCIFTNIQNSVEKEDDRSVLESRIRFASIHESVSDTFDDFLNKSAQKLKKIIKECSTSKKGSMRTKKDDYSPMKENVYSASPFNISLYSKDASSQQQQQKNISNMRQQQQSSLKKYQEKISRLQENKQRLQERLNSLSNSTTIQANSIGFKL